MRIRLGLLALDRCQYLPTRPLMVRIYLTVIAGQHNYRLFSMQPRLWALKFVGNLSHRTHTGIIASGITASPCIHRTTACSTTSLATQFITKSNHSRGFRMKKLKLLLSSLQQCSVRWLVFQATKSNLTNISKRMSRIRNPKLP